MRSCSALWCRYCYGETESGKAIPPNDPSWDRLQAAAKPARSDPKAWLAMGDIFGDLAKNPAYVNAFSAALAVAVDEGRARDAGRLSVGRAMTADAADPRAVHGGNWMS